MSDDGKEQGTELCHRVEDLAEKQSRQLLASPTRLRRQLGDNSIEKDLLERPLEILF